MNDAIKIRVAYTYFDFYIRYVHKKYIDNTENRSFKKRFYSQSLLSFAPFLCILLWFSFHFFSPFHSASLPFFSLIFFIFLSTNWKRYFSSILCYWYTLNRITKNISVQIKWYGTKKREVVHSAYECALCERTHLLKIDRRTCNWLMQIGQIMRRNVGIMKI